MRYFLHSDVMCDNEDCFAYEPDRHECTILNNTDFGNRKCPFAKRKKIKNKEKTADC